MVTDRDEVVDALKGGVLRGREVRELSAEWGEVFAIDIAAAELREAWSEARTRLRETGRWPVAVTAWNGRVEDEIFLRWLYGEGDNSPAAICERASALTLEDALARPHLLNAVAASRPPVVVRPFDATAPGQAMASSTEAEPKHWSRDRSGT